MQHSIVRSPMTVHLSRHRGRLFAAALLTFAVLLPAGAAVAQETPEASFQLAANDKDRKYERNDRRNDRRRDRDDRGDRDRGREHRNDRNDRDRHYDRDRHDRDRHDRDHRHYDRDHRRHDRDHYRHQRSHRYHSYEHRSSHPRRFSIPRRIAAELVYELKPYYYGRVYYEEHHHYHPVYSFPVYIDEYVTYRPHAYCEGNYFAPGYFSNDGPRFSISLRF